MHEKGLRIFQRIPKLGADHARDGGVENDVLRIHRKAPPLDVGAQNEVRGNEGEREKDSERAKVEVANVDIWIHSGTLSIAAAVSSLCGQISAHLGALFTQHRGECVVKWWGDICVPFARLEARFSGECRVHDRQRHEPGCGDLVHPAEDALRGFARHADDAAEPAGTGVAAIQRSPDRP